MKPHLIILGAPGSGKGTQASKLIQKGFKHISTGDLLRSEIAKNSELGQKVSGILSRGELVDDDTVMALLKANCDIEQVSYIFDGFPRNIAQAQMLEAGLLQGNKSLAVYFKIDVGILSDRIVSRRTCEVCGEIYNLDTKPPLIENICDRCGSSNKIKQRKDDNREVVSGRLKIFTDSVESLISFYKTKGNLIVVDASLGEEEIFKGLEKIIS